jgi:hypothetical protein
MPFPAMSGTRFSKIPLCSTLKRPQNTSFCRKTKRIYRFSIRFLHFSLQVIEKPLTFAPKLFIV